MEVTGKYNKGIMEVRGRYHEGIMEVTWRYHECIMEVTAGGIMQVPGSNREVS